MEALVEKPHRRSLVIMLQVNLALAQAAARRAHKASGGSRASSLICTAHLPESGNGAVEESADRNPAP
jgi:hypothetical protein